MSWIYLVVAGLLEVAWSLGLKHAEGFTKLWPSVLTVAGIAASMWLLGLASKEIPVATAYAVWVGIGATGAALASVLMFGEPMSLMRGVFLGLLLVAIAGLKLTAADPT